MAATVRRQNASVEQRLLDEAFQFDFFQAVRLLLRLARAQRGLPGDRSTIGGDCAPHGEPVRFRVDDGLSFAASDVLEVTCSNPGAAGTTPPYEVAVTFMGLFGPAGALPHHYSRLIVERQRERDFAFRDFLDLFHHRIISLFYRAWCKYRLPIRFEEAAHVDGERDWFAEALSGLVGAYGDAFSRRLGFDENCLRFYAGHFARRIPSAVALEGMLREQFDLPVEVRSFQGEWLELKDEDKAYLRRDSPCQLGLNVNLGDRVWSVESRFRLRLGPLSRSQFRRLLPTGDLRGPLCQFVRAYVGPELDFDVQLVLRAEDVSTCRLGGDDPDAQRLGWSAWLRSGPATCDDDSPVFAADGDRVGWPN